MFIFLLFYNISVSLRSDPQFSRLLPSGEPDKVQGTTDGKETTRCRVFGPDLRTVFFGLSKKFLITLYTFLYARTCESYICDLLFSFDFLFIDKIVLTNHFKNFQRGFIFPELKRGKVGFPVLPSIFQWSPPNSLQVLEVLLRWQGKTGTFCVSGPFSVLPTSNSPFPQSPW